MPLHLEFWELLGWLNLLIRFSLVSHLLRRGWLVSGGSQIEIRAVLAAINRVKRDSVDVLYRVVNAT